MAAGAQTVGLDANADAPWARFDAAWYQRRYGPDLGGAAATPSALMAHYLEAGHSRGYAPNPLFDETWYLKTNEDAAYALRIGHVRSGFEHYCVQGYLHASPHWLFDLAYYRERYADLTQEVLDRLGLVNHYAHFLRYGAREGRIAHRFFWTKYYWAALAPAQRQDAAAQGVFQHFLAAPNQDDPEIRTTPYFVPGWYRETYPAVEAAILSGTAESALHHYLTNETPADFNPNPIFSESVYLRRNDDVAQAVAERRVRSGYHHFIAYGVREHRFFSRAIDLEKYAAAHALVRADLRADTSLDAYLHLLTVGGSLGLSASPQASIEDGPGEDRSKTQFRSEARLVALAHARHVIDFTVSAAPMVSVVMIMHNRFALTVAALASLRDNVHGCVELILVDSGSTDETTTIETVIKGAKLVKLETNEGFVRAGNAGLAQVTADTVLFLNNDIRLSPRAVTAALQKLRSSSDIGAVGGKIIRAHGVLQEAGGVIWRDGSTAGILRDGDPLDPAANYARDVDYCSAVFLLAPTVLVKMLGGFDLDYAPSYYEDTDLCVRMQQLGFRVVYDPAAVVHHLEYGSLDTADEAEAAMERGRQTFLRKHGGWLAQQPERGDAVTAANRRSSGAGRILFIDDTVPVRVMGSGFVRANDIIGEMIALGYTVTVFPINPSRMPVASIYADFPDSVEILHGQSIDALQSFLDQNHERFHLIWVSRTHNVRLVKNAIKHLQDEGTRPLRLIIDTEAVAASRDHAKRQVRLQTAAAAESTMLAEFEHVPFDAPVVCVNEAERALLQTQGLANVSVLGHFRKLDLTPKLFEDRKGLLILGAIHEADSPNHDALYWFVEEILPLVTQALGPDIVASVAGYQSANVTLADLADHPQLRLLGCVPNTRSLYNDNRVFLAPTRFAAGIPYKIHEAASFGLPIVTTGLIATQTGWDHGTELLVADEKNPRAFAEQVIALYRSAGLWQSLRLHAERRLTRDNSQSDYRRALGSILADAAKTDGASFRSHSVARSSCFGDGERLAVRIA